MKRKIQQYINMINVDPAPRLTLAEMAWVRRQKYKPGYPTIVWPGDNKADRETAKALEAKYTKDVIVFEY